MNHSEVIHSFLEERHTNENRNELENHICIRFIRKKFKCLIILFLTICIVGETLIMSFDKINFDKFDIIFNKLFPINETSMLN